MAMAGTGTTALGACPDALSLLRTTPPSAQGGEGTAGTTAVTFRYEKSRTYERVGVSRCWRRIAAGVSRSAGDAKLGLDTAGGGGFKANA